MKHFQHKSQRRRKRGVLLTTPGLERFQQAKIDAEYLDNCGQRYTLEALREITGISTDTLTKVLTGDCRVDKQTLKYCFEAFGLDLISTDYYSPELGNPSQVEGAQFTMRSYAMPGGPLPLTSPLYVERPMAEKNIYQALDQPGALIRIKGSCRTGKTSMMARISHQALVRGYQPISISFQLAETKILQDLNKLLQWFCASVSLAMGAKPQLEDYWDSVLGSKLSCKIYFEQYLLSMAQQPIVLLLDDVDRLYQYPEVADEFFGFLRSCYEEAKTSEIWQLTRFVMSQTAESCMSFCINKSPFSVGVEIPLLPFTPKQVQTLALSYELEWSLREATALCELVGGKPYLVHLVVHHSWSGETSITEVLDSPLVCGIFSSYLQQKLRRLQQTPSLFKVFSQVLSNQISNSLTSLYQLQSMGLVMLADHKPQPACNLFANYFSDQYACLET